MAGGIGRAWQDYITQRRQLGQINAATARIYRECLGLFASFVGPERSVSSITRRDVEAWVIHMRVAPATTRLRLSTLHVFYRWAILNGHARTDPTLGVAPPRLPRRLPRAVRPADVARLLTCCADARCELIVLLMCQEGLRAVEIARLEEGDIDFNERLVRVRGKGGHERVLPVSDETWRVLVSYLSEHPTHAGALVRSYRLERDGRSAALLPARVSGIVREAMREAGIGLSPHRLRHTMATDLFNAGANVREVQAALGHVSLGTTQVYLPLAAGAELRSVMGGREYRRTVGNYKGEAG